MGLLKNSLSLLKTTYMLCEECVEIVNQGAKYLNVSSAFFLIEVKLESIKNTGKINSEQINTYIEIMQLCDDYLSKGVDEVSLEEKQKFEEYSKLAQKKCSELKFEKRLSERVEVRM